MEKTVGLVDSFAHDDHELRLLHWFIWIFVIVTAFIFQSNLDERRRNCSRRVETEKESRKLVALRDVYRINSVDFLTFIYHLHVVCDVVRVDEKYRFFFLNEEADRLTHLIL